MRPDWTVRKIKDFTKVMSGGTPRTSVKEYYDGGEIGWITPADLTGYDKSTIAKGKRNITELGLRSSSAKLLPTGTVLFSSRAPIGHVAIAEQELATNQGFKNILPSEFHDPKYLYWYLKSIKQEIELKASGTTFKEISASEMGEIEIVLPPAGEQRRIAAVLDKAKCLIDQRRQLIAKLDELVQTTFLHMFGDISTNPRDWPIKEFNYFASIDTKMINDFQNYAEYPHIGIDSIEKNTGKLLGYRTVAEDNLTSGKYLFTPEHIIYSKIRPYLNKVAVPNVFCKQKVQRIAAKSAEACRSVFY
ncbi:restriction endonuclease subunit S [Ectobacillus ponti]|uniref:Restriction endonuclease subunit S n=1 Tax=Ectobacillus ponti TaxID=2961894 RepID=A0AA41X592_9BACI|nr:restriction endonuclease subunit S [Ectobacillus ponti]MCP8969002.1 restriction endonuclease subunit S [Ectobacillus ponti]